MTDTYHTILSVAKSLFVKQGYTATSMRQIAEAVGIGKATIYHHFPDKEAILMTLVNGNIACMRSSLMAVEAEAEPRRRFQVAAVETLRFLYETADLMQIARREVPGARELIVSNFITFYNQYSELLKESLVKGMEMSIFRPLDPEDAARVFMTMIQGSFALVYLTGMRVETPEKVSARLLDIFFNGIEAVPVSAKG
jgi:TetR/AcrR family transcriptional regulator, cholesterol catabolism regulator